MAGAGVDLHIFNVLLSLLVKMSDQVLSRLISFSLMDILMQDYLVITFPHLKKNKPVVQ